MIVYYKSCPTCYKLLPHRKPMIIRDTDISQRISFGGKITHLMPGDTLSVFCGGCAPRR